MAEPAPQQKVPEGARRAAALLLGLGPEVAATVFRQLGEPEAKLIAQGARELKTSPDNTVPEALQAFVQGMEKIGSEVASGDEVLRGVVEAALGAETARRAFDSPKLAMPDELLGPVADADAESLAMVLSKEQPQTVALVLSSVSPEKAAQVMDFLPDETRPFVVRRMAVVESVAPEVLREVRNALTGELQALVAEGMRKLDGRAAALEILRRSTSAQQSEVLQEVEKDDPKLAAELKSKLFTFEDLSRLTDRDLQTLTREIDSKKLLAALKGGSAEIRDKFLRNMSQRASQLFLDDLAAMGPVKLSSVEEAQTEIARQALELSDKGQITIVRATEKMV